MCNGLTSVTNSKLNIPAEDLFQSPFLSRVCFADPQDHSFEIRIETYSRNLEIENILVDELPSSVKPIESSET